MSDPDELLQSKIEEKKAIDEICDNIISQLESAQAKNKIGMGRADELWFTRARGALRHNRRKRQQLQDEISELKRKKRLEYSQSGDRLFLRSVLEYAKSNMTDEQYEEMIVKARNTREIEE